LGNKEKLLGRVGGMHYIKTGKSTPRANPVGLRTFFYRFPESNR